METGVLVTISIFVLGVVYHSGRLSVRVEHLEDWRRELSPIIKEIGESIANIEQAVIARKNP